MDDGECSMATTRISADLPKSEICDWLVHTRNYTFIYQFSLLETQTSL